MTSHQHPSHTILRAIKSSLLVSLLIATPIYAQNDRPKTGLPAELSAEYETSTETWNDPLEPYNRVVFTVNDKVYEWVLKPVTRVYSYTPKPGRKAVKRFFRNLGYPKHLLNNLLQGKFKEAGVNTARFGINTTVGLAGFFDPAQQHYGLDPEPEDFGQTLGVYGLDQGPPLVLPIIGMSSVRDTAGRIPDYFLNPINYLEPTPRNISKGTKQINNLSLYMDIYEKLKEEAVDDYIFFRDLYYQSREHEVTEE